MNLELTEVQGIKTGLLDFGLDIKNFEVTPVQLPGRQHLPVAMLRLKIAEEDVIPESYVFNFSIRDSYFYEGSFTMGLNRALQKLFGLDKHTIAITELQAAVFGTARSERIVTNALQTALSWRGGLAQQPANLELLWHPILADTAMEFLSRENHLCILPTQENMPCYYSGDTPHLTDLIFVECLCDTELAGTVLRLRLGPKDFNLGTFFSVQLDSAVYLAKYRSHAVYAVSINPQLVISSKEDVKRYLKSAFSLTKEQVTSGTTWPITISSFRDFYSASHFNIHCTMLRACFNLY